MEILQLPHIYLKQSYEPASMYVRRMAILGTLGLVVGFASLYCVHKFGVL